ncbi:Bug family tripartite tricarboxylate transporter substrate binding protein [Roseomonas sp. CCTCC AB2023176]|uniref:Bug family tripartite tricarboxylate transporter substrate binding protein n=1 Tax=Roseomonas sp. CCTCC AB2023176 TaxID=3342640 RepID=UPI0035D5D40D
MHRRPLLLSALAAAAARPARADDLPRGPFRIVSGFAPGGSIDTLARFLARLAQDRTGRTFVVENRPGAGGTLGASAAARAAPTGETLLIGDVGTIGTAKVFFRDLPYDSEADFVPVILAATQPIVMVTATTPTSLPDLIARARANPGRLTHGAAGVGNLTHLLGEELRRRAGIEMTDIHYRSGGEGITAALKGEVDLSFFSLATALPHLRSGAARALAVLEPGRLPDYPDLPPAAETLPGYVAAFWYGLHAPAATPPATVQALNAALNAGLRDAEATRNLTAAGFRVGGGTPQDYGAVVARERETWGAVIRRLGLEGTGGR